MYDDCIFIIECAHSQKEIKGYTYHMVYACTAVQLYITYTGRVHNNILYSIIYTQFNIPVHITVHTVCMREYLYTVLCVCVMRGVATSYDTNAVYCDMNVKQYNCTLYIQYNCTIRYTYYFLFAIVLK